MWPVAASPVVGAPWGPNVVLDRSNPITRNMVVCAPLQRSLYDPAAGRIYSMVGSGQSWALAPPAPQKYAAGTYLRPTRGNPRFGLKFNGTAGAGVKISGDGPLLGGRFAWTVAVAYAYTALTANGYALYNERNPSSGTDYLQLFTGSNATGNSTNYLYYENDAGTNITLNSAPNTSDGFYHVQCGTKLGTALSLYVDGVLQTTGTFGSSSDAFTNANITPGIGYNAGNGAVSMNGTIFWCYCWTRCLSAAEVYAISANPWQIFSESGSLGSLELPAGGFPEYFWFLAA